MKEKIRKEDLTEYRRPDIQEMVNILPYLTGQVNKQIRRQRILSGITGCLAGIMLYSGIHPAVEFQDVHHVLPAEMALAACLLLGCVFCIRLGIRNKGLLKKFTDGDFEVLECTGENFNPHVDSVSKGVANVRTKRGVLCNERFLIDIQTAQQYEGQTGIPLFLVRQREYKYYELLTENKIKER